MIVSKTKLASWQATSNISTRSQMCAGLAPGSEGRAVYEANGLACLFDSNYEYHGGIRTTLYLAGVKVETFHKTFAEVAQAEGALVTTAEETAAGNWDTCDIEITGDFGPITFGGGVASGSGRVSLSGVAGDLGGAYTCP